MIIFKHFHNFPDNLRLMLLRIIANKQKAKLIYSVTYGPCRNSGK